MQEQYTDLLLDQLSQTESADYDLLVERQKNLMLDKPPVSEKRSDIIWDREQLLHMTDTSMSDILGENYKKG